MVEAGKTRKVDPSAPPSATHNFRMPSKFFLFNMLQQLLLRKASHLPSSSGSMPVSSLDPTLPGPDLFTVLAPLLLLLGPGTRSIFPSLSRFSLFLCCRPRVPSLVVLWVSEAWTTQAWIPRRDRHEAHLQPRPVAMAIWIDDSILLLRLSLLVLLAFPR